VASPWLQQKKIEEARLQFFRSRALQRVASFPSKSGSRSNLLFQVRETRYSFMFESPEACGEPRTFFHTGEVFTAYLLTVVE